MGYHSSKRRFLLLSCFLQFLFSRTSANCFWPNGTDANAGLSPNTYSACESAGGESMCCLSDQSSPSLSLTSGGTCRSDGLCAGSDGQSLYRTACTDQNWHSPGCIKLCVNGTNQGNGDIPITQCNDGSYCCGSEAMACCNGGNGVWLVNGEETGVKPSTLSSSSLIRSTSSMIASSSTANSPTSTSSSISSSAVTASLTSSSRSASAATAPIVATASSSPQPAISARPSVSASQNDRITGARIGGLIGGLLGLALILIALWCCCARRRRKLPPQQGDNLDPRWTWDPLKMKYLEAPVAPPATFDPRWTWDPLRFKYLEAPTYAGDIKTEEMPKGRISKPDFSKPDLKGSKAYYFELDDMSTASTGP